MVWGLSEAMDCVRTDLPNLAESDCSVLIVGETGTGKGMLARELHQASSRGGQPFVHVDCAALASSVIESELFGHERGAFTGASAARKGRFELASTGTVFLDEISELSPEVQAKLLRVLHDRRFERVGGTKTMVLDARVVAATNRSLPLEVAEGRFRSDLYYRLAVVEIELPPLRNRVMDLEALVEEASRVVSARLGREVKRPTAGALSRLCAYSWPGNGREVFNIIERVAVRWPERDFDQKLAERAVGSRAVPEEPLSAGSAGLPPKGLSLEEVLMGCGGNVSLASRKLGVPRSTFRHRLAKERSKADATSESQLVFSFGAVSHIP